MFPAQCFEDLPPRRKLVVLIKGLGPSAARLNLSDLLHLQERQLPFGFLHFDGKEESVEASHKVRDAGVVLGSMDVPEVTPWRVTQSTSHASHEG